MNRKNRITILTTIWIGLFSLFACQNSSAPDTQVVKPEATEAKQEKETVEAPKIDTLKGIDVSHYQGDVDWKVVKEGGMHFGIAKSTQGVGYTDPQFKSNWENIAAAGLYRGTYHFYVANDDPTAQAEHFINTVGNIGEHHINPILDLEATIGDLTVEEYQKNVLTWLKKVEESMGVTPVIYTNRPFGNANLNNEAFNKYHLWLAEYGAKKADVPDTWQKSGWSAWQFTSHDELKGVNGAVDESRFLSTLLIQK